jgi:uncharacterized membrane protein YkgB
MLLQAIVALGLLNVWLLRFNMSTEYRGGEAKTLVEEFAVYGLPQWFCYFVGILKVSAAVGLLVGFLYPTLILPSSGLIVVLMIGAVSMHLKVGDPIRKAIPAAAMLLMSTLVFGVACYA